MKKIIGVRGLKGVGKGFVADVIAETAREMGTDVLVTGWSDPMKEFLADVLGIDRKHLFGNDKDKNFVTTYRWSRIPLALRGAFPRPMNQEFLTAREIMQFFGTSVMREMFDPFIWINTSLRHIKKHDAELFLMADTRFENEMEAIKSNGGELWRVVGVQRGDDFAKGDPHTTERQLLEIPDDVLIENSLTDDKESIRRKIIPHLERFLKN